MLIVKSYISFICVSLQTHAKVFIIIYLSFSLFISHFLLFSYVVIRNEILYLVYISFCLSFLLEKYSRLLGVCVGMNFGLFSQIEVCISNWGLCGEIVLISFCELICGELHEQHPDACQDIELGSPFINDYGQHLHFRNIAVISSMVLRTEFYYSKNNRNIWHVLTYRIQLFEKQP